MLLRLSREGVFPITVDAQGRRLEVATGLTMPGTIQGEGRLAGVPSLFVRLQGCNLRCLWTAPDGRCVSCDTAHTWNVDGGTECTVEEVVELILRNGASIHHVVVTGGEPLLQADALAELLSELRRNGFHTTVESNGTVVCPSVIEQTDLLSLSPKLSSSVSHRADVAPEGMPAGIALDGTPECVRKSILLVKQNGGDVQLKFVVASPADEEEIKSRFAECLSLLAPSDVFVMPMGVRNDDLHANGLLCLQMCLRNGWRYCPRLHIDLFGNKEAT